MNECVQHAVYLVHVQKTLVSIPLLLSPFLLLNDQILTEWQSGPCFLVQSFPLGKSVDFNCLI